MTQQLTKRKPRLDGPGPERRHLDIEKSITRFTNLTASGTMAITEAECLLVRLLGAGAPIDQFRDVIPQLGLAVNSASFQLDSLRQFDDGAASPDGEDATISRMSALLDRALATVKQLEPLRSVVRGIPGSLDTIEPVGAKLGSLEIMCAELRDTLFDVPLQQNGTPDLSKGGV
jgi:hypothetical protein